MKSRSISYKLQEFKIVPLQEVLVATAPIADTPEKVVEYFRKISSENPYYNPSAAEHFWVFFLNTRRKVIGCEMISKGTLDTILVHPREVFRSAIVRNSAAIIIIHNHPSGDSAPSEADIKVTRDIIKGGQLLKIELLDHVIIGTPNFDGKGHRGWSSLRELGYFYN